MGSFEIEAVPLPRPPTRRAAGGAAGQGKTGRRRDSLPARPGVPGGSSAPWPRVHHAGKPGHVFPARTRAPTACAPTMSAIATNCQGSDSLRSWNGVRASSSISLARRMIDGVFQASVRLPPRCGERFPGRAPIRDGRPVFRRSPPVRRDGVRPDARPNPPTPISVSPPACRSPSRPTPRAWPLRPTRYRRSTPAPVADPGTAADLAVPADPLPDRSEAAPPASAPAVDDEFRKNA